MDVSFSAWRHSREESLQLKGDSFSFLFDRRYTNRLNRMSRVFFEAYVAATKELAALEDRFPSLSEIDAKMESGAVYAFKDRLMKNTEFFEEVKISGVSYLVPRALKFVDVTGTYTDLILNFEEGSVVLPTRRKTPLPVEGRTMAENDEAASLDMDEANIDLPEQPSGLGADKVTQVSAQAAAPAPSGQMPSQPQNAPSIPPPPSEVFADMAGPRQEEPARRAEPERAPSPPEKKPATFGADAPAKRLPGMQPKMLAALGLVLLLAAAIWLFANQPAPLAVPPVFVEYSAYLSNTTNDSYLALEIVNNEKIANDMEMTLPPDIDRSISARGGIVTISHGENTVVRMNSSSDASIKIYLNGSWTSVPIGLAFSTPSGYDTSLLVHEDDYLVTRKNDTLILKLNLTEKEVKFEQSYSRKGQ
ncbi:MAG TPA: hypothetical protein PKY93_02225 [Methanothrix sp.]|nr:hypothetical protein [Methanothrix sp.]HPC89132.1 hypothetical protein [Methanothrix sp.]HQI67578.1 hypothetical protein [Methanothrix sp.]HRS84480.1 hypothetical protein [Methanothrix sp.]HRT16509.1 hypothetical protein [Methanothrix sp.]